MNFRLLSIVSIITISLYAGDTGPQTYNFGYIGFHTYPGISSAYEPCYSDAVKVQLYCNDDSDYARSFSIPISHYEDPYNIGDPPKILEPNIVSQYCSSVKDPYIKMSSPASTCPQGSYTDRFYLNSGNDANRVYVITDIRRSDIYPNYPWYSMLYTENFANATAGADYKDSLLTSGSNNCSNGCRDISFNGEYYHDWQNSASSDQDCGNCDGSQRLVNKIKSPLPKKKSMPKKLEPSQENKKAEAEKAL